MMVRFRELRASVWAWRVPALICAALYALVLAAASADAQRGGTFQGSLEDPAIRYSSAPVSNLVDALNKRLDAGAARLQFSGRSGYLRSVLDALKVPIDSQLLVF